MSELTALVAVTDDGGRLRQRLVHGAQDEGQSQTVIQLPANDITRVPIHDGYQVEPATGQTNVGDVNGMIINDKFCLSRSAQLQLSWSRIGLYERRQQNKAKTAYPSDDSIHSGGNCETPMADSTPNQSENGWATALGSRLSTAAPLEPSRPAADQSRLQSNSGGAL